MQIFSFLKTEFGIFQLHAPGNLEQQMEHEGFSVSQAVFLSENASDFVNLVQA